MILSKFDFDENNLNEVKKRRNLSRNEIWGVEINWLDNKFDDEEEEEFLCWINNCVKLSIEDFKCWIFLLTFFSWYFCISDTREELY